MRDFMAIITEAIHGAKTMFEVMSGTAKILCSSTLIVTFIIINILKGQKKKRG